MALFDINFNQLAEHLIPPDKRLPKFRAFIRAILNGIHYNNTQFTLYRDGSSNTYYDYSIHYQQGDEVVFNGCKWTSAGNNFEHLPGTDTFWDLQEINPIGSNERIHYNGQKLLLEYALNRRVGLQFRQPGNISDIYITNNAIQNIGFPVGQSELNSAAYYLDHSIGGIVNETYVASSIQFTIHIPVTFYTTYFNDNFISFRSFVDQLIPAGLTYTCTTY